MNRFDSLVGLALAGVIALGSSAAQAAPAKSGANATPQKSSQAARTPAQRLPGQKPPPWYWPPGPSSHEGSGGSK